MPDPEWSRAQARAYPNLQIRSRIPFVNRVRLRPSVQVTSTMRSTLCARIQAVACSSVARVASSHAHANLAAGVGGARQNGVVSNPELVTALDLDQWSDSLAAQTTLPILVRRLILATASVTEISMRARGRAPARLGRARPVRRRGCPCPAWNLRLGAGHE